MIVASVTPMMRQYLEIKSGYPDAILFFRLGDFYEMFMEDAVTAARVLDITLTSRNKGAANEIPLCGIPYHSCQPYIARLVEQGYKVAICEQVEDPRDAKGIVKREVVRVVTPGLVTDSDSLKPKENNFLMALAMTGGGWGMAVVDISTGEFRAGEMGDIEGLRNDLLAVSPREVLLPEGRAGEELRRLFAAELDGRMVSPLSESVFGLDRARERLLDFFGCATLEPLGCAEMPNAVAAAGAVIHYLRQTLKGALEHIRSLNTVQTADHMVLDEAARRNLELTGTLFDGSRRGSLLGVLDRTVTSMGARRLRQWLQYPLLDLESIRQRHEAVAELADQSLQRTMLRAALDGVHDLERLNGKIAMAHANARDLVALRNSLQRLPSLLDEFAPLESRLLMLLQGAIDPLDDLLLLLAAAVVDDPPLVVREGGMIREGYRSELDELRTISREGKGWIARLEVKERERTGIASLKIRFNRVFGYYIEVTKSQLARIPEDYQRRQTLANAERYVTPALQEYEEKVLGAEERMAIMEYDLFQEVRQQVTAQARRIQQTATALADIDVLLALADLAHDRGYVRPQMEEGSDLHIIEGRHPVIDALQQERFVPNDVLMDTRENQLLIITGPNMAGKSTFMRQVALIVLLAQIGSLVPAKEARLGVVDRIFTRVGASDNLARGQSTFMVEMIETATILRQATPRSLILLDEIGRGTSTFDGVSIAWAVAEYLHDHLPVAAKTLFATHYHELTDLALTRPRVQNYTIAVREWNDQVIFLRKIVRGGASHSYGIQVARLAGLPQAVVERAKEILVNLEGGEFGRNGEPKLARTRKNTRPAAPQLSLFNTADLLGDRLREIDTSLLTPLEALNILDELKRMA